MKITWDERKRITNLASHEGLDFADLELKFFTEAVIIPASKGRQMAIGLFRTTAVAVVFSYLGSEAIAVISMRRADRKEREYL